MSQNTNNFTTPGGAISAYLTPNCHLMEMLGLLTMDTIQEYLWNCTFICMVVDSTFSISPHTHALGEKPFFSLKF